MKAFSIEAAQAEPDDLIDRAEAGEHIQSRSASGVLVRVVPLTPGEVVRHL